jgi:hypothetical protein
MTTMTKMKAQIQLQQTSTLCPDLQPPSDDDEWLEPYFNDPTSVWDSSDDED